MTPDENARLRQLRAAASDRTADPEARQAAAAEALELAIDLIRRDNTARLAELKNLMTATGGGFLPPTQHEEKP